MKKKVTLNGSLFLERIFVLGLYNYVVVFHNQVDNFDVFSQNSDFDTKEMHDYSDFLNRFQSRINSGAAD